MLTPSSTLLLLLAAAGAVQASPLPKPQVRSRPRSTLFHNVQYASAPDFDPLHHLAGIAPYFNSPGVELNPSPPEGCIVDSAAYLFRHSNIYANDFDYEDTIAPFLYKIQNYTSRDDFANSSLPFLANYTALLNTTDPEDQIGQVPPSGLASARNLGAEFRDYLGHLLPNSTAGSTGAFKVWTATAARSENTSTAFVEGLFGSINASSVEIIQVGEGEESAANTLTPHKTCEAYSGSAGSQQSSAWKSVYAQPIADRLNKEVPAFNFTVSDIVAMQELCGYDTVISNITSPFCTTEAFSNEDWLGFEYANDIMYHYSLGYGQPAAPYMGLPWVAASADLLLPWADVSNNTAAGSSVPLVIPSQKLFLSFTHREEPALIATALGLFRNNATSNGTINGTFPLDHINRERAWKTSEILPFLGHIGLERISCASNVSSSYNTTEFIRVLVNNAPIPIPEHASGPEGSTPADEFVAFLANQTESYGDFVGTCNLTSQANATDVLSFYEGNVLA